MDLDTLINHYVKNLPPKKKFLVRSSLNLSIDQNLKSKRNFHFYNKQIDAEREKKNQNFLNQFNEKLQDDKKCKNEVDRKELLREEEKSSEKSEENSSNTKESSSNVEEKILKISKVFTLNEEDKPQFTLLDNEIEDLNKNSDEQPKIIKESEKDSNKYKLQKTGPNSFKISIPGSFCKNSENFVVSSNLLETHQKLPDKVLKKSTKIWRPFEDSKSSEEILKENDKNSLNLMEENQETSDEVEIIENSEEIIDLTDLDDHPELNSSSNSDSSDRLIIDVQDELTIKTEIFDKKIKQEKIEEFQKNNPELRKRKLELENGHEPKRRRMTDSYQKFNEKFLKLILQRAQDQNQEKVICRFYQCLRCGVKIYLKKVFDHHVKNHRWFGHKEMKVGYGVIRMKNKNLEN